MILNKTSHTTINFLKTFMSLYKLLQFDNSTFKMANLLSITFLIILPSIIAQRGYYSGSRSQGYKDKHVPQTDEQLANRFQTSDTSGTTQRIPVNAHGDRGLVDRIAQMPRDKQPFWYINANILEAQRQAPFPIVQGQNIQGQGIPQSQQTGTQTQTRGGDFGVGRTTNSQLPVQQPGRSPFAGSGRH